jgi:DNA-binding transcriptional ArsR family regulator
MWDDRADAVGDDPARRCDEVFPVLDPVLQAPARLQLIVLLEAVRGGRDLTFSELQQLTGTSAGNLSTHLRRLEEAGYVAVTKAYVDRTPVTRVRITARGRDQLDVYRRDMARHLDGELAADLLALLTEVNS